MVTTENVLHLLMLSCQSMQQISPLQSLSHYVTRSWLLADGSQTKRGSSNTAKTFCHVTFDHTAQ